MEAIFLDAKKKSEFSGKPKKLPHHQLLRVIETRKPNGLFWTLEKSGSRSVFVGCDNRTGDTWTEEFPTKQACTAWLLRENTDEKQEERQ